MLEFVVVDDNKFLNEQIQNVINGVFMKTKIDYVCKIFYDYDSVFFELVNDDSENRVYVLDLQTPHSSGLTAIRTIREHDKHSKIIIISDYCDDHFPEIFKLKYILQTIKKDNEWQESLKNLILEEVLDGYSLKINDCYKIEKVKVNDIIFIYKNSLDRRTTIETSTGTTYTYQSLKELIEKLPDNFIYSHKSQIINFNKIKTIDYKNKILYFIGGKSTDLVSRECFKKIKKRFKP